MNRAGRPFEPFVEVGHQKIYDDRSMSVVLLGRVSSRRGTRAGFAAAWCGQPELHGPGWSAVRVRCPS